MVQTSPLSTSQSNFNTPGVEGAKFRSQLGNNLGGWK